MRQYLETGKIINVHGLTGMVKVECWADDVSVVTGLEKVYFSPDGGEPVKVEKSTYQKQFALLKLEGTDDRDAAAALRGKIIYADRDDIPVEDGAHFIADLIGLPVIDAVTGEKYGEISDVLDRGAQDLYEIKTPDGRAVLMPAVKEFIDHTDLESGIYVTPIPGLFDGNSVNG